ncbi:serine hydrolase domain-containing protein [Halobacillus mangrovi]|uniref:serine hydrolase domain-containing protein n=1 Tax=Halobacillus mangrovi TaxID=402384 RepID=UPI003D98F09C
MFDQFLTELVDRKEIPGAVLHIQHKGNTVFHKAYGGFTTRIQREQLITTNTIFDLASLTKVVATLPSILWLLDHSRLELDHSIQTYIPEFAHPEVQIVHALTHTSGLPADLQMVKREESRDILYEITQLNLLNSPGKQVLYSDLGMILLGKLVERISGLTLGEFTKTHLFNPWGMKRTTFNPKELDLTASTEWYKNHYIQGQVHDEKAYLLKGRSGSAGLFGTASDVAKLGNYFLYPTRQQVLNAQRMQQATTHVTQNRGLGFEVWSGQGNELSCGRRWSEGSFGHTGFTGTSLWVDPKKELVVTFLTNIVHFGRKHNMGRIRPHLHSLIHSSLIND